MSETKRERAIRSFVSLIRAAAGCNLNAADGPRIERCANMLIDAAKQEFLCTKIRSEDFVFLKADQPTASLGDQMIAGMSAFNARVEANAAAGGPPMVACHQCSTPCPCPGNWFTCPHCGLHQSKPEVRRPRADEPEADSCLDPGRCPVCDAPFELVRPGKSQPTCDCWGRDV